MRIGGFQKFSLSDFPGAISAVLFSQGCTFRCPYCHNPELVDESLYQATQDADDILRFLYHRAKQLQGIVLTGGEPTMQDDLEEFARALKAMGYKVKLDTNGTNPRLLERLVASGLLDYIAMDVKAPLASYSRVVCAEVRTEDVSSSIKLVRDSGISHEMRTTFVEGLLTMDEMRGLAELVKGCQKYVLQGFAPSKTLDPGYRSLKAPPAERLIEIRNELARSGVPCYLRECFT